MNRSRLLIFSELKDKPNISDRNLKLRDILLRINYDFEFVLALTDEQLEDIFYTLAVYNQKQQNKQLDIADASAIL